MSGNDLRVDNVQLTWRRKVLPEKKLQSSSQTIYPHKGIIGYSTNLVQISIHADTGWSCMCCTGPFAYSSQLDTHCCTILILCSTSQHKRREFFSCWENAQAFITQAAWGRKAVSVLVGEKWTMILNRKQLCWWCHSLIIAPCSAVPWECSAVRAWTTPKYCTADIPTPGWGWECFFFWTQ